VNHIMSGSLRKQNRMNSLIAGQDGWILVGLTAGGAQLISSHHQQVRHNVMFYIHDSICDNPKSGRL
jgi:hypothetical protein